MKFHKHVLIDKDTPLNFMVLSLKDDYAIVVYAEGPYEPQAFMYWLMLEHKKEVIDDSPLNEEVDCGDFSLFKYGLKPGDYSKSFGLDHVTFEQNHMPIKDEYVPYKQGPYFLEAEDGTKHNVDEIFQQLE